MNGHNGYSPFAKLLEMDILTSEPSPPTEESRQSAAAPPAPEEDTLSRLQAAIQTAQAEKKAVEHGQELARAMTELQRQMRDLQAKTDDLREEYHRRAKPIEVALRQAEALGDFVAPGAIEAARETLATLVEEHNVRVANVRRQVEQAKAQMAEIEADPAYIRYQEWQQEAIERAAGLAH